MITTAITALTALLTGLTIGWRLRGRREARRRWPPDEYDWGDH